MLNTQQNELLQQFLTMPDDKYWDVFYAQQERNELADQLEIKAAEYESLEDDLKDAAMKADDDEARINELESALSDALSWIAGDVLPSDLAETDKEFFRLYKVL